MSFKGSNNTLSKESNVSNTNANEKKMADLKLQQTKEQVLQLTQIMQQNVERTMQRGINLESLEMNIQNLESTAGEFKTTGAKTKKKYWYKSKKWGVILAIVLIALFSLTLLSVALYFGLGNNKNNGNKIQ